MTFVRITPNGDKDGDLLGSLGRGFFWQSIFDYLPHNPPEELIR
jgi:hypothetical protein